MTDHRINSSKFGLEQMMAGELLDEFIDELRHDETVRTLKRLDDEASEAAGLNADDEQDEKANKAKSRRAKNA